MIILLYHARANGFVCKKIAASAPNAIVAVCDSADVVVQETDVIVRWDSKKLLENERNTINTAQAVILSRNKSKTRNKLIGICPKTWFHTNDIEYPCIIRPRYHYGGFRLFVCNNYDDALSAIKKCGKGWYASELIEKTLEYRVFVFRGQTIKVVRRWHNPGIIAWNSHNEGRSIRVQRSHWPKEVCEIALEATNRIGLDLCAVDVIVNQGNCPFVLELNTAPGLLKEQSYTLFAKVLQNEN